jgi:UDP-N-acetylglucosamine--N-acetylmuramyl-(pentapeptide) pyrophosphoryl-undecaprenol N-acetylglucosamine transferase
MNITLAAGGTGGHMVPAHALAAELKNRGHGVMLVTDERGARIPGLFDDVPTHILPAGRYAGLLTLPRTLRSIMTGRREAKALYREFRPDVVVGFGGYPAFPSLLAASSMGVPTVLHEQNAVLGRVNRLLAGDAAAIATAYPDVQRLKRRYKRKVALVGNPVRESVARLGTMPFPDFDDTAPLRLLVTGGSQGASILGTVVPAAMGQLPTRLRHRLQIVQQSRPDDIEIVRDRYAQLGIPAELLTYIEDMPDKIADAHLVIARAGASTIAELTAAGRPAILVPLPSATDDHQTVNAQELARVGGARVIAQDDFTPSMLAEQIAVIAGDGQALGNAAARALSVGRPQATRDLADLVERVANKSAPVMVGRARAPSLAMGAPA